MLDPDFITEGEKVFEEFMRMPIIETAYDSGTMVFDHDFVTAYPQELFCSHFEIDGRPICVPSERAYKKGQKIYPVWSYCGSCRGGELLFETGLTTYVPDLGDWVPLGIFESGIPVLLSSSFAEERE